ncbi:hypothetical protein F2Y20_04740 [Bacteroides caccae]|uniref:Uncharacterized protein n=1 Tax=Bacteroides caccae TaxID=47678 RepID=A0A413J400_9BACE|nr:hypothetical protein CGC64_13270 [Bacteroides caccae]MBE6278730.1 hypothetical protein [Bacteroides sp.]KAA2319722.1 hypothetical protein F2Y29_07960 [Bacteroides caccae]KAA2321205.1 hypothetical protein F2Y23_23050 [Bacteroides caccae]KAA2323419.1 hypothetical protein F2Y20_04740 [Bacteroides caccae]
MQRKALFGDIALHSSLFLFIKHLFYEIRSILNVHIPLSLLSSNQNRSFSSDISSKKNFKVRVL